jgi:SAM-dependent methyltransferase
MKKIKNKIEMVSEMLREAISFLWLRPENGLFLASNINNGIFIIPDGTSLDLACGDGTTSFFMAGGRFDFSFDIYSGGTLAVKTHQEIVNNNIDVFDYFDDNYNPKISKKPQFKFTYGMDQKEMLLKKASLLDFYEELKIGNFDEPLPFSEGTLDYVYCNSIYWSNNPSYVLKEIYRILRDGGFLLLDVFTTEKYRYDFYTQFPQLGKKWAEILNRGRLKTNPGLQNEFMWERMFSDTKFNIEEKYDIIPINLYHIWNVGLRPLFPILKKMVSSINKNNILSIKKDWVDLFTELFLPFMTNLQYLGNNDAPAVRLQYLLRK